MKELVLPSGRFARQVRRPNVLDLALSFHKSPILMLAVLAQRTVSIDDEMLPLETWLAMDAAEFFPLVEVLNREMNEMISHLKGIA